MTSISLAALPNPLISLSQNHADVQEVEPGTVRLTARAGDDLFADPSSDGLVMSASVFALQTTGDFQFRAKVKVDFQEKFDSGVLIGYFNDQSWFKICAEVDPIGRTQVVTVVTRGRSDDANSTYLVGDDIHLRISRMGRTFALHSSSDGSRWDLARYFTLGEIGGTPLHVGIAAQSPAGNGTRATFSEFGWEGVGLSDSRDGS